MPEPSLSPTTAISEIHRAVEILDHCAEIFDDPQMLATMIYATEQAYRDLAATINKLQGAAMRALKARDLWRVHVDGLPHDLIRSRTGKTARWDGERAASAVAAQLADELYDKATGAMVEDPPPYGAFAHRVAMAIVDTAGLTPSKAWRKGALEGRGLDPEMYVTESGGDETVRWDQ